jgi:hypothetical protein
MKTSVDLNEAKVKEAKRLTRTATLKELLDKALDALIAQSQRQSMDELLGTGFFEGDLERMRGRSGHTG